MRRLLSLLLMVVFCLGGLGGRTWQLNQHLQKTPCTQGLHCSILPASDEPSADLDEAEQPVAAFVGLVSAAEPHDYELLGLTRPLSQSQDNPQGLSCGGLPD